MIPTMNVSSHCIGNPGDLFIYWGFQYLMHEAFGKALPWLPMSKFNKKEFINRKDLIKKEGYIIYVGTPQYNNYDEWCEYYDWGIWQEIFIPWKLNFYAVAGGAGIPKPGISVKEFTDFCLSSKKTKAILNSKRIRTKYCSVRDKYALGLTQAVGIDSKLFPCTASWSSQFLNIQKRSDRYTVLVPPSAAITHDRVVAGNNPRDYLFNLYTKLYKDLKAQGKEVVVVSHDAVTYNMFKDVCNSFYTTDALTLLNFYKDTKEIISSRIHACIPVQGIGDTKVLSLPIDTRGAAVQELGIKESSLVSSVESILSALDKSEPLDKKWFASVTEKYKESLYNGFEAVIK